MSEAGVHGRELDNLRAGDWRIECPFMSLSNGMAGEACRFYTGPGEICLEDGRLLEFVLYDQNAVLGPAHLEGLGMHEPDGWIPDSEFFDLEATDLKGRTWKASDVRPGTSGTYGRPGIVVRGSIRQMVSQSEAEADGKDFVWLFYPERLQIPSNVATITLTQEREKESTRGIARKVWEFRCCELTVTARPGERGVSINALADEDVAVESGWDTRLQEALWFALGQPVTASVVQERRGYRRRVVVSSRPQDEASPDPRPPFRWAAAVSSDPVAQMASVYFRFVREDARPRYHPLSVWVRRALRARDGTLEEQALALSVSIEGVIRHSERLLKYGGPEEDVIKEADRIEEALAEHIAPSILSNRYEGWLGAVRRSNTRSALKGLAEAGKVSEVERNAWEDMRHVATHGREFQMEFRELFSQTMRLRVLLAKLVFEVVGYSGPYTDWGDPMWAERTYSVETTGRC